jgi:hypothetical protein
MLITDQSPPPADAAAAVVPAAAEAAPAAAPAVVPPAAAAAPLSFGQRLAAASAGLAGRGTSADAEALRAQLAAVTGERDRLLESIRTSYEQNTALQAQLAAARASLAEAESAVTDFEARVAASSVELVASAGVPVRDLPAAVLTGASAQPATRAELEAKMAGKTTAEALQMLRDFNAAQTAQSGKN